MLSCGVDKTETTCYAGTQHLSSITGQLKYKGGPFSCKNLTTKSFSSEDTSCIIFMYKSFLYMPLSNPYVQLSFI